MRNGDVRFSPRDFRAKTTVLPVFLAAPIISNALLKSAFVTSASKNIHTETT